ncbi:rhodanese-like domain-containing protein [Pedobacter alpinus]|uniref:Rhodanese-like domain-containing protein n=1 Tax=Pedobacter alpinus TaxID=1590643 RepID=A0ABW5TW78_9SPHI
MIQFLKTIFGLGPKVNYKELLQSGAQLIDVRTKAEFQSAHIKGAVNIPLQTIEGSLSKIKKDKPVITCCASGMRSASAKSILTSNGFKEVYNAGGWISLNTKIN